MTSRTSPTVRARRLRRELRRLREEARMTAEEVAHQLGWHRSKVSRIENGHSSVGAGDVRDLLALFGITGEKVEALATLARQAKQKGWWFAYGDVLSSDYVGFEAEAAAIHTFEGMCVPGIVQTEAYARALIVGGRATTDREEIDRVVETRIARAALLTRDDAPQFWAVVDEAALRRLVGGPDVMREQLERLVAVSALPNVELQVLPFPAGAHAAMGGTFAILRFAETADPGVVFVEGDVASFILDEEPEIARYTLMFDHLRAKALDPDESAPFIAGVASEMS